jgi:hypothetical protein
MLLRRRLLGKKLLFRRLKGGGYFVSKTYARRIFAETLSWA